ncbi:hypothetical protein Gohar_008661, partial [Gossypium harknessii]|nr:hypothetical protein [Gossypium harknessii]
YSNLLVIEKGKWSLIHISRWGPNVSHFFFADDLVIFCKVELEQARLLQSILNHFCDFSGHKISTKKSNIFFSKGTNHGLADHISHLLSFHEVQDLGTYLGVPLLHDRVTNSTLSFIVEKGSSSGHPKLSLVRWDSICQPKSHGGLRFRHLFDQNMSFLMKVDFNLISKDKALWNVAWLIGNSTRIRCWKDSWISKVGPLLPLIPAYANIDSECTLKDLVMTDGAWNLDIFRIWLREDVIKRIVSIPPPYPASGPNRTIVGNIFESFKGHKELKIFLWLASKHGLLTNSKRTCQGIANNKSCSLCGHDNEDTIHVLRDCPTTKEIWLQETRLLEEWFEIRKETGSRGLTVSWDDAHFLKLSSGVF